MMISPLSSEKSRAPATLFMRPGGYVALFWIVALLLSCRQLSMHLPLSLWGKALWDPDGDDMRQIIVHYGVLPRIAVAWIAGGVLSLAGVVFQQVLRNPMASPMTLGVSAGAQFALALALSLAPGWLGSGREWVASAGGLAAIAFTLLMCWRRAFSPLALVLAGMIIGLYCGALSAGLQLFSRHATDALFYLWGGGSLVQQDWGVVRYLLPRVLPVILLLLCFVRPLVLLGLDDASGKSLGVSLFWSRIATIVLATLLATFVVSAVGVIGFIDLAAPALVTLAGARTLRQRMLWGTLLGAALLGITDCLVQTSDGVDLIPTGAAAALLGGPLMLWLLPRLRAMSPVLAGGASNGGSAQPNRRITRQGAVLVVGCLVMIALIVPVLMFGNGPYGWRWSDGAQLAALLDWRAPRAFAALGAGAMLAAAGVLIQRLTGNAMASPELLGISGGTGLGLMVLLLFVPLPGRAAMMGASSAGAAVTLVVILAVAHRAKFAPDRIMLAGIAVSAFASAASTLMSAGFGTASLILQGWMSGSTYQILGRDALQTIVVAAILVGITPLFGRALAILPLGEATSRALGLSLGASRIGVLLCAAMMTAAGTLVIGPLSFVGLMAPHIVRLVGVTRAVPQVLGSALLGGIIMLCVDWVGRNALFPYEIPAGLVASLIGCPYLIWLLYRNRG